MESSINGTVYVQQTKNHIKSQVQPYLDEWKDIQAMKDNPDITKEFILDWVSNLIWKIKEAVD